MVATQNTVAVKRRRVTRSIKADLKEEPGDEEIKKKVVTKKEVAKVTKKVVAKLTFEDNVGHIPISPNCELPEDFIAAHSEEFINGVRHLLSVDPSLYRVVVSQPFDQFQKENQKPSDIINHYWFRLVSSVISQQVSGAAARSIRAKFEAALDHDLRPQKVLTKTHDELRAAGLSNSKVKYITHISQVFSDPNAKVAQPDFYVSSSLDELYQEFVALKGIGLWSAKMFAIFTLREMDVFAHEDLGIARGAARYFEKRPEKLDAIKSAFRDDEALALRLKNAKKTTFSKSPKRDWTPHHDEYVKHLADQFAPYRSVLMVVLWRLSATNVEAMKK